jgi:hypothetical protein
MKHRTALGIALVVCAAAEAAEPIAAAPAVPATPVQTATRPTSETPKPEARKPLDLRIGDIRRYMMPDEYREALNAANADENTVVVEGNRELLAMKSDRPVPNAIMAPFWAIAHPLQSWRILVPDLKRPPPGPPDVVPPPIFRWGP